MKADSWEFILDDINDTFALYNWHSVALKILRRDEVRELYREHGGEMASKILSERNGILKEEGNRKNASTESYGNARNIGTQANSVQG